MINKFEAVGIFVCVAIMAFALFLVRVEKSKDVLGLVETNTQLASLSSLGDVSLETQLHDSFNTQGELQKMIIDDVVLGEGKEVQKGDTVSVHYIGTLQSGVQFDNSYTKGEPFVFRLGEGRVIAGWEEGILGMKEGGQRILVVPPHKAYKDAVVGPIPANSTLVFAVELLDIE